MMNYFILLASALLVSCLSLKAGEFPLDISQTANMDFKDDKPGDGKGGWSDQGPENDMRNFDITRKNYNGIEFSIIDPLKNDGKAVMTFDSPQAKTGLTRSFFDLSDKEVKGKFIYLLHTSCWNQEAPGTEIGSMEVLFKDGSGIEKKIRNGRDIADWWGAGNLDNAQVVVRRENKSTEVGVYFSKFRISDVDRQIDSIKITSQGKAVWIVAGLTVSSKEIYIDSQKKRFTDGKDGWKAADMSDIRIKKGSALDLSGLVENAPAGKYGRVICGPDESLVFENAKEKPLRFFGFNGMFYTMRKFETGSKASSHALIEEFAGLCRLQGYDMIRPLNFDIFLMEGTNGGDADFNPDRLDIADKFITAMKKEGIYTYLTLGAYRLGLKKDWGWGNQFTASMKTKMYLGDERIRKSWKASAEKMLNHINPYTGIAWKDDPAIACIEFYNEQELGFHAGKKSDMAEYANPVWRKWLKEKYATVEKLSSAWKRPVKSFDELEIPDSLYAVNPESNDYGLFLRELGNDSQKYCNEIVRKTGYKGLITQYNFSKHMGDGALRWEMSQIVSVDGYFAHPSQMRQAGSRCRQDSMLKSTASYWRDICSTRLSGRPFMVPEYNHMFWNPYQHENGLAFSAYSSLQNFSGLLIHEDPVDWEVKYDNCMDLIARNPVARANEFLSAMLFKRGDASKSPKRIELQIPQNFLKENCNVNKEVNTEQSKIALLTGFSVAFPDLNSPSGLSDNAVKANMTISPEGGAETESSSWFTKVKDSDDKSFDLQKFTSILKERKLLPSSNISDPENGIFQSDTEEITLRSKESLIKVITERTEGISLLQDKSEKAKHLSVETTSVPACIAASAIDMQTLKNSKRIVFIYSTEMAYEGMETSPDGTVLRKTGSLPVLLRCGKVSATLENGNADKMSLYALAPDGIRKEKLPLEKDGKLLKIKIDTSLLKNGPTVFFELIAE